MTGWRPISEAPKDGSWVLGFGTAYPELAERGSWITADTKRPRVPHALLIKWVEAWYDKEVDLGDGTYRKERTQGYAYWWPEPHAFHPTHWMPLPPPPDAPGSPQLDQPTRSRERAALDIAVKALRAIVQRGSSEPSEDWDSTLLNIGMIEDDGREALDKIADLVPDAVK